MQKIAVISAILEDPAASQQAFNHLVSAHKGIVKGRMGLPFDEHGIAVIAITVVGTMDDINALTGKLGALPGAVVKTAVSKKELA